MENDINHMPWPTEIWEDYLHRSRELILNDGLTIEDMNNDSVAKNYVINYIESELFNKDKEKNRAINGSLYYFDYIKLYDSGFTKVYPVIIRYQSHFIQDTTYFRKNGSGGIEMVTIPVVNDKFLIK